MAVSIAGLRRNIKNVAHNYTDAQVGSDMREFSDYNLVSWRHFIRSKSEKPQATTHGDPRVRRCLRLQVRILTHLPSPPHPSILFNPLCADLTYNMVAFSEIMQMIWKRLNDHGKNWRHVYKAMVLLEYLIKTGSEKVERRGDWWKALQGRFILGRPAMQRKHFRHSDSEGFPVRWGQQGSGTQREGESQGHGGSTKGRRAAEEREDESSEGEGKICSVHPGWV